MYCFFCDTVHCHDIERLLMEQMDCIAFSPRIVQRKWVKGKCTEEVRDFLPGYVFLYTQQPVVEFQSIYRTSGIIRLLGDREAGYCLAGEDKQFAEMLYAYQGVIGILKAYTVGDRIRLAAEPLSGYEGEVIRVDRRKGRAQIRICFDKKEMKIWAGFDLIDKISEQ